MRYSDVFSPALLTVAPTPIRTPANGNLAARSACSSSTPASNVRSTMSYRSEGSAFHEAGTVTLWHPSEQCLVSAQYLCTS